MKGKEAHSEEYAGGIPRPKIFHDAFQPDLPQDPDNYASHRAVLGQKQEQENFLDSQNHALYMGMYSPMSMLHRCGRVLGWSNIDIKTYNPEFLKTCLEYMAKHKKEGEKNSNFISHIKQGG